MPNDPGANAYQVLTLIIEAICAVGTILCAIFGYPQWKRWWDEARKLRGTRVKTQRPRFVWFGAAFVVLFTASTVCAGILLYFRLYRIHPRIYASSLLVLLLALVVLWWFLAKNLVLAIEDARTLRAELTAKQEEHESQIASLGKQQEFELDRAYQIRDIALAESRTARAALETANSRVSELEGQVAALKERVVTPPDDLPVILRPTKGQSHEQFLIVTNTGERQGFRGRCTIFQGSPENAINSFGLKWESGDAEVYLDRGESRKLLIAKAWQDRPHELEYICLCADSADDEVLTERWHIGAKPTVLYRLEVSIFGRKSQTFHKQQFIVRPGEKSAAIEMYEI